MDGLDQLLNGFINSLTLVNLIACFIGALVGTLVGVLPGLGPTVTMALMLPFTLKFGPTTGLIMMTGVWYDVPVGRLSVGYRLRDFLSGHVVLGYISLDSIRVLLERRPGERFNYQEVLRLGGGGGGRPRLIAFRDARIRDLLVTIRTPGRPDSTVPRRRTRHVTAAVLPYARLSSPLPGERGTRLEFSTLDGVMSDPALTVVDAEGAIEILADTIAVDLRPVRLRGTETVMRGRFYALDRGPLVDLAFEARTFDSDDLTALFRWLPAGVTGAGRLDVRHAVGVPRKRVRRELQPAFPAGPGGHGRLSRGLAAGRLGALAHGAAARLPARGAEPGDPSISSPRCDVLCWALTRRTA